MTKDRIQRSEEFIVKALSAIDKTFLPVQLKLWYLQFGLLPSVRWSMTVYEVAISEVEKFERIMNKPARKWLAGCHVV